MNKVKILMLNHPVVSIILMLPFSLVFVFAILDLIINIIIPFIFALLLTGWVFSFITGSSVIRYINKPFWFIKSNRY